MSWTKAKCCRRDWQLSRTNMAMLRCAWKQRTPEQRYYRSNITDRGRVVDKTSDHGWWGQPLCLAARLQNRRFRSSILLVWFHQH